MFNTNSVVAHFSSIFILLAMLQAQPISANSKDVDWPQHGLSHMEQRFSPLHQVTDRNVGKLRLDWYMDVPSIDDGLAATPIIENGIIYMTSSFANVFAVDGKTGELIWKFSPGTTSGASFSNSWASRVNRGVAVLDGRVFVATPDCRLIAIHATEGTKLWEKQTCDPSAEYSITGAPRVAKGKVFIGNGISDFGARGYVSAYDAASGDLIWRFWNVPGNPEEGDYENEAMEMAAKTWADGWAKNGGGSAWDAIVYDEEFNQLYFGTDSSIPYNPEVRSPGGGDNLFTNSIIAVDADTGKYKWHYQTVPNDAWDYNAASHIILADIKISGKKRKVLMQAPKNGFFYVIDRKNGKLISAEPYIGVNWASHIDLKTGRPVESPSARYYKNKSLRADLTPSLLGGHNWHPMSYNKKTGLVYIPAHELKTSYYINPNAALGGVMFDWYGDDLNEDKTDLKSEVKGKIGRLIGWDPVKGKAKWQVDHELPMNGGVMSTAGNLVFQGTATGSFNAYAADTGKKLWSYDVQASVQAPPVTYKIDGKQYVLASVGGGGIARFMIPLYGTGKKALGPSRLVAFSLEGEAALPPPRKVSNVVPKPPVKTSSVELIKRGEQIFEEAACGLCHGSVAQGRRPGNTSVKDLRYMTPEVHSEFKNIVLGGAFRPLGMLPFEGVLTEEDVDALYAYIVSRQWELFEKQKIEKE